LGCSDVVDILVESANERTAELMRFLGAATRATARSAPATVIRSDVSVVSVPLAVGALDIDNPVDFERLLQA
jgi:hypothetical protein